MRARYQKHSLPSLYSRQARSKAADTIIHKLEDDGILFNRMMVARVTTFLTDYTNGWSLFPCLGGSQGNVVFYDYFAPATVAANLKRCDLGHRYVLVHFTDDNEIDVFVDSLSNLLETASTDAREFVFGYDGKSLGQGYDIFRGKVEKEATT